MAETLAEEEKPARGDRPRPPSQPDPDDTGIFRWYQDLIDRILPREKDRDPK